MSLTYEQLLHDVALRMNALVGAQFTPLQNTYAVSPLLPAHFKSADWPYSSFRDAILMAEEVVALAIASTPAHPWRAYLNSQTASLANGEELPKLDTSNHPIIGVYGGVVDALPTVDFPDGTPCFMQPLEVVRRLVQEAWRIYDLFCYAIDGNRIWHTRPSVLINVCIYDRTTQLTAWNAAGNTVLPDATEPIITSVALSLMVKELSNVVGAEIYSKYADAGLQGIRAGIVGVPAIPLPSQVPAATVS